MESISCINCDAKIFKESTFCFVCGARIKCVSCDTPLIKDASFCYKCGTSTDKTKEVNEKNTVVYRRTKDEVFCEVALSNEVGKEGIIGLIQNLTSNQDVSYKRLDNGNDSERLDSYQVIEDKQEDLAEPSGKNEIGKEEIKELQFPHVKDIEINLECNEGEWILIYAFYLSDFGKKMFTRKAVYDRYMDKRRTKAREKGFSAYWKLLFKNYISTVNDSEYKFKTAGIEHAKNLILGKAKGSIKNVTAKKSRKVNNQPEQKANEGVSKKLLKRQSCSSPMSYNLDSSLNLNPQNKPSLKEFFKTYKSDSHPEYLLIFIYYLQKVAGYKNIHVNQIYTCYKNIPLKVPNIIPALNNTRIRKGWIDTSDWNDLKISVAGENYLELEMPKTSITFK